MKSLLEKEISVLKMDNKLKKILKEKEIDTVFKLCNYSRLELNGVGFTNNEINEMIVSLQLVGLDLKKNHAKKNTILESLLKK